MQSDTVELALATKPQEIAESFAVMQQLRPQLTLEAYVEQVNIQQQAGYQLLLAHLQDDVVGVAGFIVGHKLAWGKHLYVDDLVTCQNRRSSGVGQALLDWLCDYARAEFCQSLHLDSGVQRFGAHRFYLREGMHISSHHFAIDLV